MCDTLVALADATANGVTLFAKNSDRPPLERQVIDIQPSRRDRSPLRTTYISVDPHERDTLACVLSRPDWCWGAEHGVNEAGVAIGNEAIYTTLDPRPFPDALIGMDLVRLALERATSAADGVDVITTLLERYGQGGSGHHRGAAGTDVGKPYWSSFLIADPIHAWVVETSGSTWSAERVERTRAISNRTTIPAFDALHRHPRQATHARVDPRLAASNALLGAGVVTWDAIAAHMRSHDSCGEPGWSVCMHVPGVEQTTASIIAALPAGAPPVVHLLLGSPCEHEYVRFVVPGAIRT